MASSLYNVTVDARDPGGLARFWAEVLGARITAEDDEEVEVELAGDGHGPTLLFVRDATEKTVKNRIHFDLNPDDRDAEVERLLGLGATQVDIGQGDVPWVVLADPEGNEFCVLRAR